ncbi:hypothetical protein EWH99_03230 [Sporolactobacillus sp. THM7-7]|nr:hypothetical protein EWH99_03230 [Sporolactobacillus sp. THM7-7]
MCGKESSIASKGLKMQELDHKLAFLMMHLDLLEHKLGRKTGEVMDCRYRSYRQHLLMIGWNIEQIHQRIDHLEHEFSALSESRQDPGGWNKEKLIRSVSIRS